MILNYCDKHNPTSIQNGLSKHVTQYIIDDLPINDQEFIFVEFYRNQKLFFNVIFTKEDFDSEGLKNRYDFEVDFPNEDLENTFFSKYITSYCSLCVKEYEEKHGVDLVSRLIKPSFFEFD